jgi:glyoxylase-like metal-dependent hydrolase (beta-lactamase superfamily II)
VEEQQLHAVAPEWLFSTFDAAEFDAVRPELAPLDLDAGAPQLVLSIHTWIVRTPDHLVLVDTGSGNGKERPRNPAFHRQNIPFLERLSAAGVKPENVDYVINTHLHVDHAGWNTVLKDGRWVPTFPNARYIFPRREQEYYSTEASHNDVNIPSEFVYEDSVKPIIDAELVDYVEPEGGKLLDIFEFIPTPGHSIGHMSVKISSRGEQGLIAGDLMHHPTQVYKPEWNTIFCEFVDEAVTSRRMMLEYCADTGAKYFAMHFAGSGCGYVDREGDGFSWKYA